MDTQEIIFEIQKHLQKQDIDCWLLYDFHHLNDLAINFLKIKEHATRRFFYLIPKSGSPIKILHYIEPSVLHFWPGEEYFYNSYRSLHEHLQKILLPFKKIAMEYSPNASLFYLSKVDGGTVDLIRSFGKEVVSSSSFLHYFTSTLDSEQMKSYKEAALFVDFLMDSAWNYVKNHVQNKKSITEYDIQQKILSLIQEHNYVTEHVPICAVNENSANPHYYPTKENFKPVKEGDFLLIDLWARKDKPRSIFADITRVFYLGNKPSFLHEKIFSIVYQAQTAAIDLLNNRLKEKKPLYGYELDRAARNVISSQGYEKNFLHKTGHSIDTSLHGSGTHLDDFEMHDDRQILENTCFSIEPGIYLPNQFGVRLELDVLVTNNIGHIIMTRPSNIFTFTAS